jgi:hypothetical protein
MRKTITLKLTPELRARLEKYCEKNDRSASWVIKNLIDSDEYFLQDKMEPKKFKGVSEKLTISIPADKNEELLEILSFWGFKLQDYLRTQIYHLTKGRKYK